MGPSPMMRRPKGRPEAARLYQTSGAQGKSEGSLAQAILPVGPFPGQRDGVLTTPPRLMNNTERMLVLRILRKCKS